MKPRSLLAVAVLGLFMLQPVSNLAEAFHRQGDEGKCEACAEKAVALKSSRSKRLAAKSAPRKAVSKTRAKPAAKNVQRVAVRMAPAAAADDCADGAVGRGRRPAARA